MAALPFSELGNHSIMDIANHSHIDTTKRYDRRDRKRLISALKTVDY